MNRKKIFYVILLVLIIIVLIVVMKNIYVKQNSKIVEEIDVVNSKEALEESSEEVIADMENIIDIKEKMFIQQLNDIYINLEQYEGKTIRIEGFMYHYKDDYANDEAYYVMRRTPGCCGDDGSAGIEIVWENAYPNDVEWVEAIGVIKKVYENEYYGNIPVLYLTNLEVKEEKGAVFVTQ